MKPPGSYKGPMGGGGEGGGMSSRYPTSSAVEPLHALSPSCDPMTIRDLLGDAPSPVTAILKLPGMAAGKKKKTERDISSVDARWGVVQERRRDGADSVPISPRRRRRGVGAVNQRRGIIHVRGDKHHYTLVDGCGSSGWPLLAKRVRARIQRRAWIGHRRTERARERARR